MLFTAQCQHEDILVVAVDIEGLTLTLTTY
jgi:hypothetical protein